jgi:Fe2+ transport system protein FeoA
LGIWQIIIKKDFMATSFSADLLKVGVTSRIERIMDSELNHKLLSMGISEGNSLVVQQKTLFGHSFYVRIGDSTLALRKGEMACIQVDDITSGYEK